MREAIGEKEGRILSRHPLFAGLDREETLRALSLLRAERAGYERGAVLRPAGLPVNRFGIVLRGAVRVCSDDIEGNRMIMAEVEPGSSFGESLCFLETEESPVYMFASEELEMVWLETGELFAPGADAFRTELQRRFTAALAEKNLSMNNRIQVLSRLRLRDKLTAYFTELAAVHDGARPLVTREMAAVQGSSVIRLPMNRDDTAAYIGANRSALSRELARMKREGLIDYRRNEVRILR